MLLINSKLRLEGRSRLFPGSALQAQDRGPGVLRSRITDVPDARLRYKHEHFISARAGPCCADPWCLQSSQLFISHALFEPKDFSVKFRVYSYRHRKTCGEEKRNSQSCQLCPSRILVTLSNHRRLMLFCRDN